MKAIRLSPGNQEAYRELLTLYANNKIENSLFSEYCTQYNHDLHGSTVDRTGIFRDSQNFFKIDYKRYPLIGKNGLYFRLTFDSQISAIKSNNIFYKKKEEQPKACIPGYEILELKFDNNIPPWFHRIIQSYNLKRVSVSKFVLGCEATGLAFDHDGR